jgi:putative endonuclease
MSDDYKRRFEEHNHGRGRSTKPYAPFKIIMIENFPDRLSARKKEKYWKSGCGREIIKRIIENS